MTTETPAASANATDAIAIAAELGRLDFVSTLLAIIGLLLALGGIYAFINFRAIARRQATEEAERVAEEVAERTANAYLERELSNIVEEYRELAANRAAAEVADQIAGAQEDGAEDDEAK